MSKDPKRIHPSFNNTITHKDHYFFLKYFQNERKFKLLQIYQGYLEMAVVSIVLSVDKKQCLNSGTNVFLYFNTTEKK